MTFLITERPVVNFYVTVSVFKSSTGVDTVSRFFVGSWFNNARFRNVFFANAEMFSNVDDLIRFVRMSNVTRVEAAGFYVIEPDSLVGFIENAETVVDAELAENAMNRHMLL